MRPLLATTLIALIAATAPAVAEQASFRVMLGSRTLGNFTYDGTSGGGPTIVSVLDNTPMGVGRGRFEGTSRPARTAAGEPVTQYVGRSDDRTISVVLADGRPVETVVQPASEETPLSDVAQVPAGVIDPATAFSRIADAQGCPEPFTMYDGRRVISVATADRLDVTGTLACRLDYRVIAGPGHLSPFRFTSLRVDLTYDTTGTQALRSFTVEAGLFTLTFQS